MLVDMNSFFASVEQQANPFLRGIPLGVAVSPHPTSCLIATSKEAKAMGIKNGVSIYKARKIYPNIKVVPSEPEKYREVSREVNRIFLDYTDQVEPYSIDESFLEFDDQDNLLLVGAEIKRRIRSEVGEWLTCSVGIAPNKFMAKLAADMKKPDGLSIIWQSQLREIYRTKKLTDLWGISHGWTKRLGKLGITKPSQLLDYPVQNLIAVFGKPGFDLWERVNGLEKDYVSNEEGVDPKSFGHSWVLNFRTTDKEKLKIVVLRLAEKAARRMRREGFVASAIYLSVLLVDGNYFHKSRKLKYVVETGLQLYEQVMKIWETWNFPKEVMHIAVGFSSLQPKVEQLSLFSNKFENLTETLDKINDKYGEFTIRPSLLTSSSDFAPDSIAFGR